MNGLAGLVVLVYWIDWTGGVAIVGVEGSSWSKCPGPGLSGFEWEGRVKKLKHRPSKGQEGWKMGESGAVIVRYQGIHTLPRYLHRYLGSATPQQVVGGHPWTYDSGCRQAVGTGTNLNLLRNHFGTTPFSLVAHVSRGYKLVETETCYMPHLRTQQPTISSRGWVSGTSKAGCAVPYCA